MHSFNCQFYQEFSLKTHTERHTNIIIYTYTDTGTGTYEYTLCTHIEYVYDMYICKERDREWLNPGFVWMPTT